MHMADAVVALRVVVVEYAEEERYYYNLAECSPTRSSRVVVPGMILHPPWPRRRRTSDSQYGRMC